MNHEQNKNFLARVGAKHRDEILAAVADHYSITKVDAFKEVTQEGAEHLLDYLVGPIRPLAHLLMQQSGCI